MTRTSITSRITAEFGPSSGSAEMLQLLNPVFPEPEIHPSGFFYFTPDEVKNFNLLFERFGLAFRATDDKFEDIGYLTELWYRLVSGFGGHIECSVYSPKLFALEAQKWPHAFREYLDAVMNNDGARSIELAAELKVENLDVTMPTAMFK